MAGIKSLAEAKAPHPRAKFVGYCIGGPQHGKLLRLDSPIWYVVEIPELVVMPWMMDADYFSISLAKEHRYEHDGRGFWRLR